MTSSASYVKLTVDETLQKLHTSSEIGLDSQQEATYRRSVYGHNVLESEEDESLFSKFISQFYEDRLILMLIASAGVSLLLGNKDDALSIALAIFFVVSVGFVQEYRSEQSLKALNNLVPPSAHVTRGGESNTALASTLVPGDLVSFSVGDRIPADVRIVRSNQLMIDESSLTGETTPVKKNDKEVADQPIVPISDRQNIAFMGTLVTHGNGSGIVVGTGRDTEFGNIFYMMSDIEKPKTPLQNAMSQLGKELSMISFGVIGVICVIGIIQGRSLLDMFQIGVSLAVAAIPEGLPIIVTVTLALGVLRMARKNAIVRRLPSVETLGSVDVVCSDKTGTLTMNKLTVTRLYTPGTDTWTDVEHRHGQLTASVSMRRLIEVGEMANNAVHISDAASRLTSNPDKSARWAGNPVDAALMSVLDIFNLENSRGKVQRVAEVPFSSERKWMAAVNQNAAGEKTFYIKGALEYILPLCTHYVTTSGGTDKINDKLSQEIIRHNDQYASQGMRILALGYIDGEPSDLEKPQNIVFAGLAAMSDPPRPGVKDSVRRLRESGVKVVMITGDNVLTAVSAARQVGIPIPAGNDASRYVMSGETLHDLTPEQLSAAIENVLVFARTSPEMKVKIVSSLQTRGHIVAMTGDGVNDAPALKLADIGVAMGGGTDVAKEAGDMILVDDDFSTILQAIKEGKAIFSNVKSFLSFQLSTSVAALSLVVVTTIFKLPNPLNPMQILWINILMDGPPAQSLGVEPADPAVMSQPPRARNEKVLTQNVLRSVAIRGGIILCGTMLVYLREIKDNVITTRDTTMSFTCFVFFDLFNAMASRSATRSIFDLGVFSNKMFNVAVGISFLGQLGVIYLPFLQQIFKTEALSFSDLAFLITLASSILWIEEFFKYQAKSKGLNHPQDLASGLV